MGKIVVLVRDGCEKCIWVLKTLLAAIANVGRTGGLVKVNITFDPKLLVHMRPYTDNATIVPQIFFNGKHLAGGVPHLQELHSKGLLPKLAFMALAQKYDPPFLLQLLLLFPSSISHPTPQSSSVSLGSETTLQQALQNQGKQQIHAGEGSPFFGLLDPQRKLESNIELKIIAFMHHMKPSFTEKDPTHGLKKIWKKRKKSQSLVGQDILSLINEFTNFDQNDSEEIAFGLVDYGVIVPMTTTLSTPSKLTKLRPTTRSILRPPRRAASSLPDTPINTESSSNESTETCRCCEMTMKSGTVYTCGGCQKLICALCINRRKCHKCSGRNYCPRARKISPISFSSPSPRTSSSSSSSIAPASPPLSSASPSPSFSPASPASPVSPIHSLPSLVEEGEKKVEGEKKEEGEKEESENQGESEEESESDELLSSVVFDDSFDPSKADPPPPRLTTSVSATFSSSSSSFAPPLSSTSSLSLSTSCSISSSSSLSPISSSLLPLSSSTSSHPHSTPLPVNLSFTAVTSSLLSSTSRSSYSPPTTSSPISPPLASQPVFSSSLTAYSSSSSSSSSFKESESSDPILLNLMYQFAEDSEPNLLNSKRICSSKSSHSIAQYSAELQYYLSELLRLYGTGEGSYLDYRALRQEKVFDRYTWFATELQQLDVRDLASNTKESLVFFMNLFSLMSIHFHIHDLESSSLTPREKGEKGGEKGEKKGEKGEKKGEKGEKKGEKGEKKGDKGEKKGERKEMASSTIFMGEKEKEREKGVKKRGLSTTSSSAIVGEKGGGEKGGERGVLERGVSVRSPSKKQQQQLLRQMTVDHLSSSNVSSSSSVYAVSSSPVIAAQSFDLSLTRNNSIFSQFVYMIGGLKFSLDDIEFGILYQNSKTYFSDRPAVPFRQSDPRFSFYQIFKRETTDYRPLFALHRCCKGGFPLMVFSENIDCELDMAVEECLFTRIRIECDDTRAEVKFPYLVKVLLDLLSGDKLKVLDFCLKYIQDRAVQSQLQRVKKIAPKMIVFRFTRFDWSLNQSVSKNLRKENRLTIMSRGGVGLGLGSKKNSGDFLQWANQLKREREKDKKEKEEKKGGGWVVSSPHLSFSSFDQMHMYCLQRIISQCVTTSQPCVPESTFYEERIQQRANSSRAAAALSF